MYIFLWDTPITAGAIFWLKCTKRHLCRELNGYGYACRKPAIFWVTRRDHYTGRVFICTDHYRLYENQKYTLFDSRGNWYLVDYVDKWLRPFIPSPEVAAAKLAELRAAVLKPLPTWGKKKGKPKSDKISLGKRLASGNAGLGMVAPHSRRRLHTTGRRHS